MTMSPVTLDIKFDKAEWKGFFDAIVAEQAMKDIYVAPATKFLALAAKEGLSALLSSKVGGLSVEASGMSARNLFVARLAGGGLHEDSHAVYEGALTSGNYFIRAGGKAARPPLEKILWWMMDKGMGNFSPQIAPSRPLLQPTTNRYTRDNHASTSVKSIKRSDAENIAWAISTHIKKYGTSTYHKPLYPGGQKRYDYVGYAVKRLRMLDQLYGLLTREQLPQLSKIMVGFWKTGRWNKGSAYQMVKPKMPSIV